MCEKQLIPLLKKQHQEVSKTLGTARPSGTNDPAEEESGPQAELKAKLADRNNWMGHAMDTAIEESFRVMDLEVKKYTTAGTTCSIIIARECAALLPTYPLQHSDADVGRAGSSDIYLTSTGT